MSDLGLVAVDRLRLLVVEDEYLVAVDLAQSLEELGVDVVGPVGSVDDALQLLESEGSSLSGAVLDINLGDERVFPVADALIGRGVPFVFLTGYDSLAIPEAYLGITRCEKPIDRASLAKLLVRPTIASGDGHGAYFLEKTS